MSVTAIILRKTLTEGDRPIWRPAAVMVTHQQYFVFHYDDTRSDSLYAAAEAASLESHAMKRLFDTHLAIFHRFFPIFLSF